MTVSNNTYIQTAISLVILSRLSNAFGNAPATKFMGYETTDAIIKYRIKPPTLSYSKPSRRIIAPLNIAIMDRTAIIRTAPKMNVIIFSRFLLLLLSKRFTPLCLNLVLKMI